MLHQIDPIEISRLTEKWLAQQAKDSPTFAVFPKTKTLLNAFYQESKQSKITAIHSKLSSLYATLYYGLGRKCECCEVNEVAFYSFRATCYCELCVDWLRRELERFPFKSIASIREEVGRTVFGEPALLWFESEYDKLSKEIYTVSKKSTSELELISSKVKALLDEHRKRHSRFFGD